MVLEPSRNLALVGVTDVPARAQTRWSCAR
jgi:hypothetical protein